MNKDIIVSIKCLVYNHAPYLRQCLDGIVNQKTNFRFEAIVHDDASTDESASIIREYANKYPHIIKPIYEKENLYSKHDGTLKKSIDVFLTGKYIAMCEGDDYWIDSFKLQKQVEYLDNHSDCGLVYTAYKKDCGGVLTEAIRYDFGDNCLYNYLAHKGGIIATASTLFRASIYRDITLDPKLPMGDVPLWIQLMHISKAHFINDVTSVYRVLTESASHSLDYRKKLLFGRSAIRVRKQFAKEYGYPELVKDLQTRERRLDSLMELYDLHLFNFFMSNPFRNGVKLNDVLNVLKKRIK